MRLSVCMILGRCDEKLINTFMSVDPIADEFCIVQTVEDEDTERMVKDHNFTSVLRYIKKPELMHEDGFLRSFADARNASFEMATGDMILWIDADDVISDPHAMKKAIKDKSKRNIVSV